jgi:predicted RNase H-like HicB family nuclease
MAEIHPLQVETEREEDGRWLAAVPALPGVMAYGTTPEEAVRKAKAVALQILADMIESGEELPEPFRLLFAA